MYSSTKITLIHFTLIMHGNDSMYLRKTSFESAFAWSLPCSMSTHNETSFLYRKTWRCIEISFTASLDKWGYLPLPSEWNWMFPYATRQTVDTKLMGGGVGGRRHAFNSRVPTIRVRVEVRVFLSRVQVHLPRVWVKQVLQHSSLPIGLLPLYPLLLTCN